MGNQGLGHALMIWTVPYGKPRFVILPHAQDVETVNCRPALEGLPEAEAIYMGYGSSGAETRCVCVDRFQGMAAAANRRVAMTDRWAIEPAMEASFWSQ